MKANRKGILFLTMLVFTVFAGINAKVETEVLFVAENDPELKIEEWIVKDYYWENTDLSMVIPEVDSALNIEPWMISDSYWN